MLLPTLPSSCWLSGQPLSCCYRCSSGSSRAGCPDLRLAKLQPLPESGPAAEALAGRVPHPSHLGPWRSFRPKACFCPCPLLPGPAYSPSLSPPLILAQTPCLHFPVLVLCWVFLATVVPPSSTWPGCVVPTGASPQAPIAPALGWPHSPQSCLLCRLAVPALEGCASPVPWFALRGFPSVLLAGHVLWLVPDTARATLTRGGCLNPCLGWAQICVAGR